MRFDRLRLEQFKPFETTEVAFEPGVTVINGVNGSGKSSLLEAAFFALYGARTLDGTMDEVVTVGTDSSRVELAFTHDDTAGQITRAVRVRDGQARTTRCVLAAGDTTVEGATDVRERVTALLRMDADAFRNCAYVRQGEVNALINASPDERQDILDDLLQLGRLEQYRERASDARVGVGRVRDDVDGALAEVEAQIADKEETNLYAQRDTVREQLDELAANRARYEDNREQARATLEDAKAVLEEQAERREELAGLREELTTLRETIEATAQERTELAEEIDQTRTRLTELRERREELAAAVDAPEEVGDEWVRDRIDTLSDRLEVLTEELRELSVDKQAAESESDQLETQATEHEQAAAEKREQAAKTEASIDERAAELASRRDQLAEFEAEIESVRTAFADTPVDPDGAPDHETACREALAAVREERAELRADLENAREALESAKQLQAAGRCPECGQPVEDSPHVAALDERRERVTAIEAGLEELADRERARQADLERAQELTEAADRLKEHRSERDSLEQLIEEQKASLAETRDRVEQLQAEADALDEQAAAKRAEAATAADRAAELQASIETRTGEKERVATNLETARELADVLTERSRLDETLSQLREDRAEKKAVNDERRDRLDRLRERRDELAAAVDEDRIETATAEKERASQYLSKVESELAELDQRQQALQERLGALSQEIDDLEALRDRRETLAARSTRLGSLYDQLETLETTYGSLRSDLRQQNLASLERMLNETFELVYENDSYSRIELDEQYRLTVYQNDGEPLDPGQLSGGERAVFNLSLRCAIYRLLAEGIEGTAPMPPLILDEPTVFLDDSHVSQLLELIDAMRELGVEQILVVSHDDELVAAADTLLRVRKDPTTNRSTVETAAPRQGLVAGRSVGQGQTDPE